MTKAKLELTYNNLIDDINFLQCETRLAEKKQTVMRLAAFLRTEGYEQLATVIEKKATELIRKNNYGEGGS